MKIPFINDTHFGFKNDSQIFREYFNNFFQNTFFPYIDSNGIREIVHLGDMMDRRKYINFETLKYVRENFVQQLEKRGMTMHAILGNHDVYYKNTNNVNSIRELFGNTKCIKLYETFTDAKIGDFQFAMVPWITQENENEFKNFLTKTTSTVMLGHFEIQGFEVLRGIKSEEGHDRQIFQPFEAVYSGHFHQKNDDGHIYYLGTQYDMTFADVDERKGFHVFETQDRSMQFVHNPTKMFYRLVYDDSIDLQMPDFKQYANTYVKLVVRSKRSPKTFDKYIGKLYEAEPHEVNIIEEYELAETSTEDVDITQDTLSIIYNEIDDNETFDTGTSNALKKVMNDLYLESFEVD